MNKNKNTSAILWPEVIDVLFGEAIQMYQDHLQCRSLAEATIKNYMGYTRRFAIFCMGLGVASVGDLTKRTADRYISSLKEVGRADKTLIVVKSAVREFSRVLVQEELLTEDITNGWKFKRSASRPKKPTAVLERGQVEALLLYAEKTDRVVYAELLLIYQCAMRVSEVCALRWQDINFENRTLVIRAPKGKGRPRQLVVPKNVARSLRGLWIRSNAKVTDPVFVAKRLKPDFSVTQKSRQYIWKEIHKMREIIGVERLFPHCFRASHATHSFDKGVAATDIQAQLGHSSLDTTQQYDRRANQGSYTEWLVEQDPDEDEKGLDGE